MKGKRSKLSKKGAKSLFTATADRTRSVNVAPVPMRGGFRI